MQSIPRRCSDLGILVALCAVLASPARADEAGPGDVATYEAQVAEGTALFQAGEFAAARAAFEAAHAIHPEPTLLFNIASTYRREGDTPSAAAAYRRFLAEAPPDHPHRELAEETVRELEAELAEAEPEPEEVAPEPALEPEPEPVEIELAPAERASAPGQGLRIAGITTGAAGAVLIVTGLVEGRRAASRADTLEEVPRGAWDAEQQALYDSGQAAERRSLIFGLVGAAAVGTGAFLYWRGQRAATSAEVSVVVTPGEAAVGLTARF